jgi:hypothetical protein
MQRAAALRSNFNNQEAVYGLIVSNLVRSRMVSWRASMELIESAIARSFQAPIAAS